MATRFTIDALCASDTARAHRIRNRPDAVQTAALHQLATLLDRVDALGVPFSVTSAFRCEELNRVVGGAKTSQHIKGEAADISTGSRERNRVLFDMILRAGLPFDQLIDEYSYGWIHISFTTRRPNRKQVLHLGV